jgi:hypothetical protein
MKKLELICGCLRKSAAESARVREPRFLHLSYRQPNEPGFGWCCMRRIDLESGSQHELELAWGAGSIYGVLELRFLRPVFCHADEAC